MTVALLVATAGGAVASGIDVGTYACERRFLVGLWHDEDERVEAGVVEPDVRTFAMTIALVEGDRFDGCVEMSAFVEEMREACLSDDFPLVRATFSGRPDETFDTVHGSAHDLPVFRLFMQNGTVGFLLRDMREGIGYIMTYSVPQVTETGFVMDEFLERGVCRRTD